MCIMLKCSNLCALAAYVISLLMLLLNKLACSNRMCEVLDNAWVLRDFVRVLVST